MYNSCAGKGGTSAGGGSGGGAGGVEGEDGYQLTMLEGDRIKLSGEANDGWQFGENTRTQQFVDRLNSYVNKLFNKL